MSSLLPRGLRRFYKKDDGTATVEAVLWLPIFFALFGLMTDAAMIFNGHSRVLRIVQDANRNLSVGRFETEVETQDWIIAQLAQISPNADVVTQTNAGIATTTAFIPATDLEVLGMFGALNSVTLAVTSQQFIEF